MWADVDKRIHRALTGVRQAFRGVLTRVDSAPAVQLAQIDGLADEILQDNEIFQHYGFTSNPLPGTMSVVLPLGGQTSHGIVIATEHGNYRLQSLAPGEVALYTDEGAKIVMKRGRVIETECDVFRVQCKTWEVNAEQKADFKTPMLTTSAQLTVQGQLNANSGIAATGQATLNGSLRASGDVTAQGISLSSHRHLDAENRMTNTPQN